MRNKKLFWGSSYDRGLENLLFIWPDIKEKHPDSELHICYGWDLFLKTNSNNPERMAWYERMRVPMDQDWVVHHGRVGKEELKKIRESCGIWAYTTDFTEINCITALETQYDGVVPVVVNFTHKNSAGEEIYTALDETVGSGFKIKGRVTDLKVIEEVKDKILLLMDDRSLWDKESGKARKFAKKFTWDQIALKWVPHFKTKTKQPLVTIYTPTIRRGWWNIMASNIASQSYKNTEWLIVDDFEDGSRQEIADKYASKYNLDIRYVRGKQRAVKRHYGLVNANNTAWKEMKGEILVLLQDFVLMPPNGIESMVDWYNKHPNDLYAPVDIYFQHKLKPDITKEDWFDGNLDVVGPVSWKNPRVRYRGISESDNPHDWEANYGMIPKSVIDRVNGWYEILDDGLGHDNTDIAMRAMLTGSKLFIDDTNIATCLDHWNPLKGTKQNILGRARKLNPPRYQFLWEMINAGKIPAVRDEKLDDTVFLNYEIPAEVSDQDAEKWVDQNMDKIIRRWKKEF